MWNRLRYTAWAPLYDRLVAAVASDFGELRRRSIARLQLRSGQRVLVVGAGTGLDLEYLPREVHVTAVDVTPAMLRRLEHRARAQRRGVDAQVMDARQLAFADASFDAAVLHLVLAVMPEPSRGLQEAERVVAPGGRLAVFDKFATDEQRIGVRRRLLNAFAKPLFSDMNRRLGPLVAQTALEVEHDEPVAFGGMYRLVTLRRPPAAKSGG